MALGAPAIRLRSIDPSEHDAFFEVFAAYHAELDPYDADPWSSAAPGSPGAHGLEAYRAAILEDLGPDSGRELFWIEADGERAGFIVTRTLPDWPDDSTNVAEIAEFYVVPTLRRRGVGAGAVQAILADHRARGTRLVEAAILDRNIPAKDFWRALGFEVQSVVTARRP